jgi:hypothetical protein
MTEDQVRAVIASGAPHLRAPMICALSTGLRSANVKPLAAVRDLLGHSDITLTQRYAHMAPTQIDDAMAVLAEALTDTPLAQQKLKKATND